MNASSNTNTECLFQEMSSSYKATAIASTVIAIPLGLSAAIGNFCIIWVLIKNKPLHSQSNILLGSLCVTDLLIGLVTQPIFAARRILELQGMQNDYCILDQFHMYFSYLMAGSSIVNMAMISLDRWFAICHPFEYQRFENKRRYFAIITIVWMIIIFLILLPLVSEKISLYLGASISVGLSIIVIVVCYCLIYRVVLRHKKKIHHEQTVSQMAASDLRTGRPVEKRRANTIAIVILVLFICYIPHGVIICVKSVRDKPMLVASRWGEVFVLMNSSINPIVYCWKCSDIRNALKAMFGRE